MANDDLSLDGIAPLGLKVQAVTASSTSTDLDLRREALDRALQFWPSMLEPDRQCNEVVKRARQYFDFLKNG